MEIKRTPPLCRPQLRRHCLNPGTFSSGEEMKISRIRKKYHSRVTGLINAMWKSRKGGAVSWLCAWLPGTHTSMHSHSLSLPAHCSPLIPPQPTGGPFIPVLFRSCSLGLDLSLPGALRLS